MICHYDEVVSFDSIADAQTDMICHYDEIVNFNSISDVQIDMICQPDKVVSFDSIPGNQNDFFLSLYFLFDQNYDFSDFSFRNKQEVCSSWDGFDTLCHGVFESF